MRFCTLILIGILVVHSQGQSDMIGATEAKLIERYGKPDWVSAEGKAKGLYYLGMPSFTVLVKDGRVAKWTWSFRKTVIVVAGGEVMLAIPQPEDIKAAKGDIKMWIDELDWRMPWKKFSVQDRNALLDNVLSAASALGAQNIPLSIDHPFVSLITGGKPENFGTIIRNDNRKMIDILAVIRGRRDDLLRNEIHK